MVPRFIEFRADLPRTPTQKVRKVALRADGVTACHLGSRGGRLQGEP